MLSFSSIRLVMDKVIELLSYVPILIILRQEMGEYALPGYCRLWHKPEKPPPVIYRQKPLVVMRVFRSEGQQETPDTTRRPRNQQAL
jgi:hypothetical protein